MKTDQEFLILNANDQKEYLCQEMAFWLNYGFQTNEESKTVLKRIQFLARRLGLPIHELYENIREQAAKSLTEAI